MLFEFAPRNAELGKLSPKWKESVRFALSVEEVGLFVNQLPDNPVKIARGLPEDIDKVFSAVPGDLGSVRFEIDLVKDGVGGQEPSAPMVVTAQAGEVEVIRAILSSSISHLLGWNTLMEIELAQRVNAGMMAGKWNNPMGDDVK